MIIAALFFYLFAGIFVASAVMVISSKNPVHSVLFLILAFVNAAGLFVLMGAEFLAMILIVVYVGGVIAFIFLFELLLVLGAWVIGPQVVRTSPIPNLDTVTNTAALGQVLYTRYIYYFQIAGVVLLIAMIG